MVDARIKVRKSHTRICERQHELGLVVTCDVRIRNPLLVSGAPRELAGWHSDRWFQAKRPRSTRITPIIEGKQLAACATRGKMERIGKIDPLPAVA